MPPRKELILQDVMTSKDIEKALESYYKDDMYLISNVYFFQNETDFLIVRKSGFLIGCEIKCSLSDFKADFKKPRHQKLLDKSEELENYFYYVCPENLIPLEIVPHYAGLIYITETGRIKEIKKAPKLHSIKHEYKHKLFNKMYYGYRESKKLRNDPEFLAQKKLIKELENTIKSKEDYNRLTNNTIRELVSEIRQLKK